MAEYIEREAALKQLNRNSITKKITLADGVSIFDTIKNIPTADVVEVVRCKDCVHSISLDKHCEINTSAYKHCGLYRGDDVRNVWHKYKKYYKHYNIVHLDDFCSEGVRKEGAEE